MPLQNGLQVIIHSPIGDHFQCEGFIGLPVLTPTQIIIWPGETSARTQAAAAEVRAAIVRDLLNVGGSQAQVVSPQMPCGGRHRPEHCHAFADQDCQKLIAFICSNSSPAPDWLLSSFGAPGIQVLPILPFDAVPNQCLPPLLHPVHAYFWTRSAAEAAPQILSGAGITSSDSRVFISYVRGDSAGLASQLFHALSELNVACYLDRFSQTPSHDFTVRLFEAIADKAFVVAIESRRIRRSQWTRAEIAYARAQGIDVMSLQLPSCSKLAEIMDSQRYNVAQADLVGRGANRRLRDHALLRVLNEVRSRHGRAVLGRREMLRTNLRMALMRARTGNVHVDNAGMIAVSGGGSDYRLHTCRGTPELTDFHRCSVSLNGAQRGAVVGLTANPNTDHGQRIRWLSGTCQIGTVDQADLLATARAIARGQALI